MKYYNKQNIKVFNKTWLSASYSTLALLLPLLLLR